MLGVAATVQLLCACNPWFLHGASELTEAVPADAQGPWSSTYCKVISTGEGADGSHARYYITERTGGFSLLEVNSDGASSQINNWTITKDGLHFAAWIPEQKGYYFFFSQTPKHHSMRFVYTNYKAVAAPRDNFVTLSGKAAAACPLLDVKSHTRTAMDEEAAAHRDSAAGIRHIRSTARTSGWMVPRSLDLIPDAPPPLDY